MIGSKAFSSVGEGIYASKFVRTADDILRMVREHQPLSFGEFDRLGGGTIFAHLRWEQNGDARLEARGIEVRIRMTREDATVDAYRMRVVTEWMRFTDRLIDDYIRDYSLATPETPYVQEFVSGSEVCTAKRHFTRHNDHGYLDRERYNLRLVYRPSQTDTQVLAKWTLDGEFITLMSLYVREIETVRMMRGRLESVSDWIDRVLPIWDGLVLAIRDKHEQDMARGPDPMAAIA